MKAVGVNCLFCIEKIPCLIRGAVNAIVLGSCLDGEKHMERMMKEREGVEGDGIRRFRGRKSGER